MTAFAVEQNICTGRSWSGAGILAKLAAFMVRAPASSGGGAGWTLFDDQSSAGTNPYMVWCNVSSPTVNTLGQKFLKVQLPSATGSVISIRPYLWWDTTLHAGYGQFAAHYVTTADAADFTYDFRGGPEFISIMTFVSSWSVWGWDEIDLDPNLVESTVSATLASTNITGDSLNQINGIDFNTGLTTCIDSNGWSYIKIINTTGTTYRVDFYSNSSYTTLVAQTGTFAQLTAGAFSVINFTGTGVSGQIRLMGLTTAAATIAYRANRLDITSGMVSQFSVNKFYYVTDYSLGKSSVNYFQVLSISGNVLTVSALYRPFSASSKVGGYPHPYYVYGSNSTLMEWHSSIPYMSVQGKAANYSAIQIPNEHTEEFYIDGTTQNWSNVGLRSSPGIGFSSDDMYITRMSPNDDQLYALQKPGICEYFTFGRAAGSGVPDGNRGYGQAKNLLVGYATGLTQNVHGRRVAGIDYTYFGGAQAIVGNASSWGFFIRETQSAS